MHRRATPARRSQASITCAWTLPGRIGADRRHTWRDVDDAGTVVGPAVAPGSSQNTITPASCSASTRARAPPCRSSTTTQLPGPLRCRQTPEAQRATSIRAASVWDPSVPFLTSTLARRAVETVPRSAHPSTLRVVDEQVCNRRGPSGCDSLARTVNVSGIVATTRILRTATGTNAARPPCAHWPGADPARCPADTRRELPDGSGNRRRTRPGLQGPRPRSQRAVGQSGQPPHASKSGPELRCDARDGLVEGVAVQSRRRAIVAAADPRNSALRSRGARSPCVSRPFGSVGLRE